MPVRRALVAGLILRTPGRVTRRTIRIALIMLAFAACRAGDAASAGGFRAVDSIQLEETPDDPIQAITAAAVARDGGLIVVDGPAGRIRRFDAQGRILGVSGRPGDGPGELSQPEAVAVSGDSLLVVERGSPRLSVFAGDTLARTARLPGQYGFWIADHGDALIIGAATEHARFVVTDREGRPRATFGTRDPAVRETPYWVFFVRERAVPVGSRVVVSSSFSPVLRVYDAAGDSVGAFGDAPPSWIPPDAPPSTRGLDGESQRAVIAEWSRSFTVVTQLAAVADTLIVVGYGHHDPTPADPFALAHETVDVYAPSGDLLAQGIVFADAIAGGGRHLLVVTGSPPAPWTITRMSYEAAPDARQP